MSQDNHPHEQDSHHDLHRWEDDGGRVPTPADDTEHQDALTFLHRMRQDLLQLDAVED